MSKTGEGNRHSCRNGLDGVIGKKGEKGKQHKVSVGLADSGSFPGEG